MSSSTKNGASRFNHKWATVIWRDRPWYSRSLNRVVDVRINEQGLELRIIPPWQFLTPGWARQALQNPISRAQVKEIKQTRYSGFPTVTITYADASGQNRDLEIAFTNLGLIPLVSDRVAEFTLALELERDARRCRPRTRPLRTDVCYPVR